MMPPRAVLTTKAVAFIAASSAVPTMPVVSGVLGQFTVRKSISGSAVRQSVAAVAPVAAISAAATNGSCTSTSISIARNRATSRRPMRPRPSTSTRRPARSTGRTNRASFQVEVRSRASCRWLCLASASIRCSACSATDTELAVPTTVSGIPARVSAATSTLSYPTPRRATTFSVPRAISITRSVIGASPSTSPCTPGRWRSSALSVCSSTTRTSMSSRGPNTSSIPSAMAWFTSTTFMRRTLSALRADAQR